MTYKPREFWDERLSEQFDLRGTGEPGLSLAYNRACYELRRHVLERALREQHVDPHGRRVLDVGCGTGFWTSFYVERGAEVTGLDIAPTSIERLREHFPQARFELADVSEHPVEGTFDIVNGFDVLYHITDDAKWEAALRHLAAAVTPGGLLLVTDLFSHPNALAEHNVMRSLERYRGVLLPLGLEPGRLYPTHVLLNSNLGPFRFLNRLPGLLLGLDRLLLSAGSGMRPSINKLMVMRRGKTAAESGC